MTDDECEKLLGVSLHGFCDTLRQSGVRRVVFSSPFDFGGVALQELELSDTIPAPPAFEPLVDDEPDPKTPNQCIYPHCALDNGWQFDSRYCRAHGLKVSGVKP